MTRRYQIQADVPKELWKALDRARLAAGGYGQRTRIIREALEAHPEVKVQISERQEDEK